MATRLLTAILALRDGIVLGPDVLGDESRLRLADHEGTVHVPADEADPAARAWNLRAPTGLPLNRNARPPAWGQGLSNGSALVTSLGLSFPGIPVENVAAAGRSLREAVNAWYRNITQWIEASSWQLVSPEEPHRESLVDDTHFDAVDPDGSAISAEHVTIVVSASVIPKGRALDRDTWRRCVDAVGAGPVPLEYQLLTSAWRALSFGHTRRCVLEAGVAADVCLTAALERQLDPRIAAVVLKKIRTLGPRAEVARALGIVGRGELGDKPHETVSIRNRAAHTKYEISRDEARSVFNEVRHIVQRIRPLWPERGQDTDS